MRLMGKATVETMCQQCGEYNLITVKSVKTIIWPKVEEEDDSSAPVRGFPLSELPLPAAAP